MATKVSVRVRMYRMGELGDCFLITFTAGTKKSQMLIDCGTFRNGAPSKSRLSDVVKAIKTELKTKRLDVVVGTHQHNDHVNGFLHCETAFRAIGIDQVWLSWLDDRRDALARSMGDKYNNLRSNLVAAAQLLAARTPGPRGVATRERTTALLGFLGHSSVTGTPPETPQAAFEVLKTIGTQPLKYLRPGTSLAIPGLPTGTVRVHVMGPPHNKALLERKNPRSGESYDTELARALASSGRLLSGLTGQSDPTSTDDMNYPFNERYKRLENPSHATPSARAQARPPTDALQSVITDYRSAGNSWRLVDDDWLDQVEGLALWLDDYTNNSSLVLAIELVQSGKVLLFAADAQTGNWTSWQDIAWADASITTEDLLARTVLYKVGHHGSHNSTLVSVFESMKHKDLSALIPVDKTDPNIARVKGWRMPAERLFERIQAKTENRVLQMDGDNPPACDPTKPAVKAAWKAAGMTPSIHPLFIDVLLKG